MNMRERIEILKGNLVMLWDHPEDHNKIQDHYTDQKFIMVDPDLDPNICNIKPLHDKELLWLVN